jgi:hypothetical protein
MRRISLLLLCLASWVAPLPGAILERLSLDDVILKSTDIVRAKVSGSYADFQGSMIYTHWKVQVEERWKGTERPSIDVLVPGGEARGFHQDVAGAPKLAEGKEYLLFLWRAKSGSTYITGLSQGIFELTKNGADGLVVSRAATGEPMLDHTTWRPVNDEAIQMRYSEMTRQILGALASGVPQGAAH